MTNRRCRIDESAGALHDLTAAHAIAGRNAAAILERRLAQHTDQGGQEPRMRFVRHVNHLMGSVAQVAHALQDDGEHDHLMAPAALDRLRSEVLYLGTAVVAMLEELERRCGSIPLAPPGSVLGVDQAFEAMRRGAVARRMVLAPSEEIAATSAGESIAQGALRAARRDAPPWEAGA